MTENHDKQNEKEKEKEKEREHEREMERQPEHEKDKESQDRNKYLLDSIVGQKPRDRGASTFSEELRATLYKIACVSFQTEIMTLDVAIGDSETANSRHSPADDSVGTQRVYKKTSQNCVLTLYLPTREIALSGSSPSIIRGIVFVDPKAIQGYRVYAQLTLTFRYGREDEEVMGLRFCNEAIMSLHQIWPRNEEPARESLSPLQDALIKRLGDGAHPFTLSLTSQAPPSVQLVPAKRYYGAPIGTSYDVRCFIADKTDEKFHRRASVKMGVRVIYRSDVGADFRVPENFSSQTTSPPIQNDDMVSSPPPTMSSPSTSTATANQQQQQQQQKLPATTTTGTGTASAMSGNSGAPIKQRKSERGESFPKLRLSPKSFRFSGRFGRSKSEIEKCPNDPFYNYSKSFQEYESCGGPQGAVDKPFLLQDGRVGLRANLDKAWYTHGEDVCVTVNIRNDSRKTVRKVRVCAIQHVDVCMFNNGKFKNVVADSDCNSPVDRTVNPGGTLTTTFVLKPQRGQTKNWIALEDTLQRSTEPEEITGSIAASAVRSPITYSTATAAAMASAANNPNNSPNLVTMLQSQLHSRPEDRNVFAIYVSYYVKVKLTLSGMGGELSLKLPFALVHVDEAHTRKQHQQQQPAERQDQKTPSVSNISDNSNKISLDKVPSSRKVNTGAAAGHREHHQPHHQSYHHLQLEPYLDRIESIDDEDGVGPKHTANVAIVPAMMSSNSVKRKLVRSETIARDGSDEEEEALDDDNNDNDHLECNTMNKIDLTEGQRIIHHEEEDVDDDDNINAAEKSKEISLEGSSRHPQPQHEKITTNVQVHSDV